MNTLHRHYKWELLGLLFLAFFFYFADRAIFGVVLSSIRAELALTDSQLGLVNTVMFFALALCMPVAGYIGDRFSRKWIITISLVFWSGATMCTGLATGMIGLIAFRSLATAGSESFYSPAAYSLLATFHRETRAFAMAVHQTAVYVGVMTSGFLGGVIADRWGWRAAFYVFGGIGIFLGLLFIFRLKDAPRTATGTGAVEPLHPVQALGRLFRVPTAVLLTVGFTAIVFVNNAYITWAPRLLQEKFGLSMTQAGGYSMFYHHITALAAVLLGGHLSDRWVRRHPRARLLMMTVAMLAGAPMILLLGLSPQATGVYVAMAAFGLCRGLYECNTHAALFDVIEPRYRGSAVAIMVMVGFIIGSQSPWLLGWFADHFGAARGLALGFSTFAGVYALGGLAVGAAWLWTAHRDRVQE
jgi:MFS family permease